MSLPTAALGSYVDKVHEQNHDKGLKGQSILGQIFN